MPTLEVMKADPDDDEDDGFITDAELARLRVAVARLKALVNDPVALMRRAQGLLEGSAQALLSWPGALYLLRVGLVALAGSDVPGLPLDDLARWMVDQGWLDSPAQGSLAFLGF
jgi:hypothetical protein